MRVLLAIDDSEFSQEAAREVENRLAAPDTTVRVLHVVGSFVPPAAAIWDAGGSLEGVNEEVSDQFQQLVDDVAARLKARGISAEGVVKEGNAGKVIIEEAKEWDADLIVVGAHGLTGLETLIMGNVARHVVDHAPCSVEVVRPKRKSN
jgi:nucleotide-binding universal stress UspA family protein